MNLILNNELKEDIITKEIKIVGLVNKKEQKVRNLVYTVNPLPYSLLNFVFDFGSIKSDDEKKYIECIISQVIDKIYYNNNENREIDIHIFLLYKYFCVFHIILDYFFFTKMSLNTLNLLVSLMSLTNKCYYFSGL